MKYIQNEPKHTSKLRNLTKIAKTAIWIKKKIMIEKEEFMAILSRFLYFVKIISISDFVLNALNRPFVAQNAL